MSRHLYQESTPLQPSEPLPFEIPQLVPDDEPEEMSPWPFHTAEKESVKQPAEQHLAQQALRDIAPARTYVQVMPSYTPGRWLYKR